MSTINSSSFYHVRPASDALCAEVTTEVTTFVLPVDIIRVFICHTANFYTVVVL